MGRGLYWGVGFEGIGLVRGMVSEMDGRIFEKPPSKG